MGCVVISGTRYIGYSLYPVCFKSGFRLKHPKGDASETLNNAIREMKTLYPNFENVFFKFMYILDIVYPLRKLTAN